MTTEQAVSKAASPQSAMLFIAQALDRIEAKLNAQPARDGWDMDWSPNKEVAMSTSDYKTEMSPSDDRIIVDGDNTIVDVPAVSPTKMKERYHFAANDLKIDQYAAAQPGWDAEPDGYDSWADVYAHGGPMWLYHANREFVMSLSREVRTQLVEDMISQDPKLAHEMSRDILKYEANEPEFGS